MRKMIPVKHYTFQHGFTLVEMAMVLLLMRYAFSVPIRGSVLKGSARLPSKTTPDPSKPD